MILHNIWRKVVSSLVIVIFPQNISELYTRLEDFIIIFGLLSVAVSINGLTYMYSHHGLTTFNLTRQI